mmetsp:Transcript_78948/g.223432  ORF Transcript_78948/g.223432 Transcript_78948/m.223432 type:complete len:231 (-) Transcript_78948:174-866(-)
MRHVRWAEISCQRARPHTSGMRWCYKLRAPSTPEPPRCDDSLCDFGPRKASRKIPAKLQFVRDPCTAVLRLDAAAGAGLAVAEHQKVSWLRAVRNCHHEGRGRRLEEAPRLRAFRHRDQDLAAARPRDLDLVAGALPRRQLDLELGPRRELHLQPPARPGVAGRVHLHAAAVRAAHRDQLPGLGLGRQVHRDLAGGDRKRLELVAAVRVEEFSVHGAASGAELLHRCRRV